MAPEVAPEEPSPHIDQLGFPALDPEGRFDLGDLLPRHDHALQIHEARDLDTQAVGPAAHLVELALDVLERDPGAELVVVENDLGLFPLTPGGLVRPARPADLQVPPGGERSVIVQLHGELGHQGRHLLAQVEIEAEVLDPQLVDAQVEPARILDHDRPARELYR